MLTNSKNVSALIYKGDIFFFHNKVNKQILRGEKKKEEKKAWAFLKTVLLLTSMYLHFSVTPQHHTDKAQRTCSS